MKTVVVKYANYIHLLNKPSGYYGIGGEEWMIIFQVFLSEIIHLSLTVNIGTPSKYSY